MLQDGLGLRSRFIAQICGNTSIFRDACAGSSSPLSAPAAIGVHVEAAGWARERSPQKVLAPGTWAPPHGVAAGVGRAVGTTLPPG